MIEHGEMIVFLDPEKPAASPPEAAVRRSDGQS
jgi:hypothetical protein